MRKRRSDCLCVNRQRREEKVRSAMNVPIAAPPRPKVGIKAMDTTTFVMPPVQAAMEFVTVRPLIRTPRFVKLAEA